MRAPEASEDARVTALGIAPVKGLRIAGVEQLVLEPGGARGDRRFYLVEERGWMVNGKHTSRHPESGAVDLPTLDLLRSFSSGLDTTEPLPFGVYGEVVRPGAVRVGDRVELV